jgi:endonuclease/exonuclease/phosphatase family metal-dependent hydrolase
VIRLLSWNVLADAYVQARFYPRVERALLARGARTDAIVSCLVEGDADVACLQEVERPLIDAIERAGGWTVHAAMKPGKADGCAIVARRGATLEAVRTIPYADGAPDRRDSGHIALVAMLRDGQAAYPIATTHLRWDPPETPHEARWAVREVEQLLGELAPIDRAIVCGDLNLEPTDAVYGRLLAAGLVDPMAETLPPTANPNGRAKRIDHILVGRDVVAQPLPILRVSDDSVLPSPAMPSDHVPIGVAIAGCLSDAR